MRVIRKRTKKWLSGDREVDLRAIYDFKAKLKEGVGPHFCLEGNTTKEEGEESYYIYLRGSYMFLELFNYYSDKTLSKRGRGTATLVFRLPSNTKIKGVPKYSKTKKANSKIDMNFKTETTSKRKVKFEDLLNTRFFIGYKEDLPKDSESISFHIFKGKKEDYKDALELTQEHIDILEGRLFRREDWNWEGTAPILKEE